MLSISHDRYGEPADVLRTVQVADPAPPRGSELLIRVAASPVNVGTLLGVRGRYLPAGVTPDAPVHAPRLGIEGAGVVEAVGAEVDSRLGFAPGVRVAFFPQPGSWNERVLVPASVVTVLPDALPFSVAAQLHLNPVTALSLLRAAEAAGAQPGPAGVIVVDAAGSSVAKLIAALARAKGISVVGLVRRRTPAMQTEDFSAMLCTEDASWREQLADVSHGEGVRVALDAVGGETATALLGCLTPGGSLITYGDLSGDPLRISALTVAARDLHIGGVMYTAWAAGDASARAADVKTFMALALRRPELFPVAGQHELADITRAVTQAERPGKTGLVLLTSAV